jgi:two-component system C4-dicarboxylate transport sensor histidine kinase DctB
MSVLSWRPNLLASVALLSGVALAAAWVLGTWIGYRQLYNNGLEETYRYQQLIVNELDRFRPIPELMAEHPLMAEALLNAEDEAVLLRANKEMKRMATIVNSSDVYLMNQNGLTIAANNYLLPTSFVGGNFGFRPYFYEPMQTGQSGMYFALGTTSLERGIYFSHPVFADPEQDPIGVIVVKVLVGELEEQWQQSPSFYDSQMIVHDGDGVVFLSSHLPWLYHSFIELTDADRARIESSLRYAQQPIQELPAQPQSLRVGLPESVEQWQIQLNVQQRQFLVINKPLPQLDWQLRVMISTDAILSWQIAVMLLGAVFSSGLLLIVLYLRERYRREAELAQRSVQLEQSVRQRTAELQATNQQLLGVIADRERAQEELKAAQHELVQAAKLAVLGQMSAGLNHEMNQPLTAIQAYTKNSELFLERGEWESVADNLKEIGTLCQRMSELTRQFKVFARKSEGAPATVDLRQPIDGALKLISANPDRRHVSLVWDRQTQPVWVHGDHIRIEQVLINLLTNALQAVEGVADAEIRIELQLEDNYWLCRIIDNGSGLPAASEQLFEPFYTTKSLKQGLGLGLSISRQIVDALGGRLIGRNRSDGSGAEFLLRLVARHEPASASNEESVV